MRNTTKRVVSSDGTVERVPVDMKRQLNYNIANLLNKTHLNDDGFPVFHTHASVYPDFIAMNNEKCKFHQTQLTALGFYTFDRTFDNIHGLYNAIYYNDVRLLKKYKEMYAGIKFVIGPDYSMFDKSSIIGDGGTAAVIRFEKATGRNLGRNGKSHIQKGRDMLSYLNRIASSENLSQSDRIIANKLISDLKSALGGK